MRINQPVTQTEIHFSEHDIILSTTDRKGVITSASPAFCKISGFSEAEMIGQSHNLVRHPDMPAEVFEWLWRSINAGRAWRGLIKNRSKSGDFYWVNATVLPVYERGRIEGYRSLRTKPARAQVEEAAALYAALKARRIKNPFLQSGLHRLLSRVTFRLKMHALLLAAAIAVAGPLCLLTERINRELNVSVKEMQAIDYLRESIKLLQLIQQHRGLSILALAGDNASAEQWRAIRRDVNRQVEKIDRINTRLLSLGMSSAWSGTRSDWQKIAAADDGMDVNASIAEHGVLIDKLLAFNRKFGDLSNLAHDPDLSVYYLMSVANQQIPDLAERMALISTVVTRVLHRNAALPEEAAELAQMLNNLPAARIVLGENIQKAAAVDTAWDEDFNREMQHIPAFIDAVREKLLKPGKGGTPETFLESALPRINRLFLLSEAADDRLNRLLEARIEKIDRTRLLILGSEFCLSILLLALGRSVVCGVLRPVATMSGMLRELGAGKMPAIDNSEYDAEFNRLKEALNQAATSVHAFTADLGMLSEMVSASRLEVRADANLHQGDYADIIAGVNSSLDSLLDASGKLSDRQPGPERTANR